MTLSLIPLNLYLEPLILNPKPLSPKPGTRRKAPEEF